MTHPILRPLQGKRTAIAWSFFFTAIAITFYFARDAYYIGFFNDDAHYILGARSLLSGSYNELFSPQKSFNVQYFPGYSMILSVWMFAFSESVRSLRILALILSISLIITSLLYAKDKIQPKSAAYYGFLLAFNSLNLSFAGTVLSDIPFTLCVMASLLVYDRPPINGGFAVAAILGILCGFSILIRPLGVLFVAAVLLDLCLKKKWEHVAICGFFTLLMMLMWMQVNVSVKGMFVAKLSELLSTHQSASHNSGQLAVRIYGNFTRYLFDMFSFVVFRPPGILNTTPLRVVFSVLLSAFMALGLFDRSRRSPVIAYFVLLYLAVIATWPVYSTRYLIPVIPLLLFCVFRGLEVMTAYVPRKIFLIDMAGITGLLLCLQPGSKILHASVHKDNVMTRAPTEVFNWIRTHTPENSVFWAINEAEIYLHTGRQGQTLHRYKNSQELLDAAHRQKINYILSQPSELSLRSVAGNAMRDPLPQEVLEELIRNSKSFTLVFQSQDKRYSIYKL